MSKIKVTVEVRNERIEIESDYLIIMHGEKSDNGLMYTKIDVENLTYEELTRSIALLGHFAIINLNNKLEDK